MNRPGPQDVMEAARTGAIDVVLVDRLRSLTRKPRLLNQAIFHSLYIKDEKITDGNLREPFRQLHAIQHAQISKPSSDTTAQRPDSKKAIDGGESMIDSTSETSARWSRHSPKARRKGSSPSAMASARAA